MVKKSFLPALVLNLFLFAGCVWAQNPSDPPPPDPYQPITQRLEYPQQLREVSRERREQAYAKLLEGQRFIWGLGNARSRENIVTGTRLAKESIQKAVELDPNLAEGYTALAELTYKYPPNDADEAIRLASIAVRVNPDNFGSHQILARLNTFKSRLNRANLDETFIDKAAESWKQVIRLDPRNAEAYAFLSAIYEQTDQPQKRIEALKNWVSAASPIDPRFYSGIMRMGDLSIEIAVLKLGEALFKEGELSEAVTLLSRAVSDNPDSTEAIELLSRAIEAADAKTAIGAIESLQQAVFANPENINLITLLAQVQARSGQFEDAVKGLRRTIVKLSDENRRSAANLQITLGDIYTEFERFDEAAAVYKNAIQISGIENNGLIKAENRDFATLVFEKIIRAFKIANRPEDVKKVIEQARLMFGEDDVFADRQLISFYNETGKMNEAIQTVRATRLRFPDDYGLLRLEASILTEAGRVEEGVGLIESLIGKKPTGDSAALGFTLMFDDFTNYLYISNLYSQARRGKEAIEAANQAFDLARSAERKQIAKLTLATALQMSGNFSGAETALREILRQTPGNPIALNNLGYFLLERDEKIGEALELIQKAVDIDPTNPSYLDSLGWAFFKLKKYAEAEKYLKDAARLAPSSATIQEHLGDVYQKQNKTEPARAAWQKALNLTKDKEEVKRLTDKLQRF